MFGKKNPVSPRGGAAENPQQQQQQQQMRNTNEPSELTQQKVKIVQSILQDKYMNMNRQTQERNER
jgi:hypothetical protein